MSEETNPATNSTAQPIIRIRSRFPKATPNIAISSGIARIRRLSGHFQDDNINNERTPPMTPSITHLSIMSPLVNENSNGTLTRLQSLTKSPGNKIITDEYLSNPSTPIAFRLSGIASVPMSPAIHLLQPPTTPGGSIYNQKFSTEHIMNIIKYKALQKLKKIESDNLKEKRKKVKQVNIAINNNNNDDQTTNLIDRSKIRMRDLLYYNTRNKTANNKTTLQIPTEEIIIEDHLTINTSLDVATIDEESTIDRSLSNDSLDSEVSTNQISAPQLKFDENGSIIINEESLIIKRIDTEPQYERTIVEESENLDNLNYNSYRKFHHTKKWTKRETAKFYKALSMIGTDFTMIQRLFAHRNRDEIKRKFKREEKLNQALIDKILSTTTKIDLSVFVSTSSDEDESQQNNEVTTENANNINDVEQQTNLADNKKTKKKKVTPKRIKKRAFIESDEEEVEAEPKPKATTNEIPFKIKKTTTLTSNNIHNNELDNEENVVWATTAPQLDNVNEEEEEELVLDLDTNRLFSINNSVLMDYNEPVIKDNNNNNNQNEDDDDDENIILDLDNNTFITNNNKTIINVDDYKQQQQSEVVEQVRPQSKSSINITRIPKSS